MSRSEYDANEMMARRAQGMRAAEYPGEAQARNIQAPKSHAQWLVLQSANEAAEAERWEAMAAQARQGMAVHEPLSHDDRQTLRRIYAALAVFWLATIACGMYFIPQVFKFF